MRNELVEGKIAFVTGAGSGLGRTFVLKFSLEYAKVLAVDINAEGWVMAKRFAGSEENANAAVRVCSEEASSVNGHALAVDGGQTVEVMKLPS